ncbi:Glu-tRNA(Gln) amidotransferase GatDE subunit D [Pyrococcus furiosus DSM 3638]|uniref:Glutamyl-tRNA(Gln) amidotransferase subunit D n=3 Tax=Pyrococcus furiosus TaxID=2261 RepID=GATD_PYRFU|nr:MULTISPECIES: Glu-tRNA(Gln) amidotransferase subunit GatD [Pyrococcus]Q8U0X0.1 RecName: Full=Glutamyl-tRNA(Gln) amidotransferase subunit D; Short=Glu-ADT subunit D [Pyrococcus furiosus DSM 3638]AAL81585.1 l-asparaginase (l-asparagine amidohydrolase) asparaginase [Pyrococcus furiosus DSM 3638]AFN04244.1 glutamyl-tRNA(Gln) amidotransferase subunit D [Pyrococcus furiosus COM1]MDK2869492.1 glutamyl-tRNA(Gln) amidotransferase subunit [Pyrococcus sp.]QEK79090.1 Glu-tRNA(Gln) amidotransferase GatD
MRVEEFLKQKGIEVGDYVRIIKVEDGEKVEYEGIVMPPYELSEGDTVVIKLDNGYNIGIAIEKIQEINVIEKAKAKPEVHFKAELEPRKELPTITILGTGGTIASRIDYETGAVYPAFTAEELAKAVPEIFEIANIKPKLLFNIFSEDMKPKHWIEIAHETAKALNSGNEGVVIAHGTDTMGYTAAALSFMLRNLTKPVVLVGAQRSSDRPSSDAAMNLICATRMAVSDAAEVMVVMHGETSDTYCLAHRGTKVRKMHTSRRDAFRSINDIPIAKIWSDGKIEFLRDDYRKRSEGEVWVDDKLEEKVALVKVYPGMSAELIDFLVDKGYKGIVIEGTGLGHTPSDLIPSIKRAVDEGVAVCMTSQCLYGRVNLNVYATGRKLLKAGVIPCEDMLPETAYVKLMWVLGHTNDLREAKKMMLTNYAGEITPYTKPNTFLI